MEGHWMFDVFSLRNKRRNMKNALRSDLNIFVFFLITVGYLMLLVYKTTKTWWNALCFLCLLDIKQLFCSFSNMFFLLQSQKLPNRMQDQANLHCQKTVSVENRWYHFMYRLKNDIKMIWTMKKHIHTLNNDINNEQNMLALVHLFHKNKSEVRGSAWTLPLGMG